MSRKPLDLELVNKHLEEQEAGNVIPFRDRATNRAIRNLEALTDGSEDFVITEDDEETVIAPAGKPLPSDEELEAMKRELAERDRIEKEQWVNSLPWWKRKLVQLRVIRYERARR